MSVAPCTDVKQRLPHKFRSDAASKPGPFNNRSVRHPEKPSALDCATWKGAPPAEDSMLGVKRNPVQRGIEMQEMHDCETGGGPSMVFDLKSRV